MANQEAADHERASIATEMIIMLRKEVDDLQQRMLALEVAASANETPSLLTMASPWADAYCDGCRKSAPFIVGERYTCSVCDNVDFCKKCLETLMHSVPSEAAETWQCKGHVMLRTDHTGQAQGTRRINPNASTIAPLAAAVPAAPPAVAIPPAAPAVPAPMLWGPPVPHFPSLGGYPNQFNQHRQPPLGTRLSGVGPQNIAALQ